MNYKKITINLITIIIFKNSFSQISVCHSTSSHQEFVSFAADDSFKNIHAEPIKSNITMQKGMMISFPTSDGKSGGAYHIAPEVTSKKALFVFHEWWGLNEHIKQEAERLSNELKDMHIFAIDLYDSLVAYTREHAAQLMSELKPKRAEVIIRGLLDYIGEDMQIATLGWCLGGGWSLQASIIAERQSKACVIYYGMPEKNIHRLQKLTAPVLFIAADRDAWITSDIVMNFAQTMSDLKKTISVINYSADHAFANPSNPHYDKEKANDAFRQAVDFIKMHF